MLYVTLTCMEREDLLIVGAQMRYQGVDHLKRYVAGKENSLRDTVEEGLTFFLNSLKRPCRIDLRTDQYWLVKSRWTEDDSTPNLAAAVRRHQINWTLLLPDCKAILDAKHNLAGEIGLCRKISEIFFAPGK
ncbi:ribonuclease H family protein [Syntrophotalea acetylenica]|uniref:Uncharacterized protein n=1 Tax=Syntrophotalea acetylenica TaxID=29542 RepID=A0A1L3GDH2_SYNAC|nr:hypothetical protein [Syntrophotalea acetylenica]APG23947.1 hypothetical protein A7E75_02090 [Syntrophotalea acetylenica]APG44528.1 hypothetical protein A6070_10710 [Syntrophotalea acetylenica]